MRLRTLGDLQLEGGSFRQAKPLVLLAYLTLEGPKPRHFLAELFWPAAVDPRNSLSGALKRLCREVPGSIATDTTYVRPNATSDAAQLLKAFEEGERSTVVDLYLGPFLGNVDLPWSEELEEWVYGTREFIAGRVREVMLHLGEEAAAEGDFGRGAKQAEAALDVVETSALEPEEAERLYTLLSAGGSARAAEVRRGASEFGLSLLLTREEARARLLRRFSHLTAPPSQLPHRNTPFVGRVSELAELSELLADPTCRLLTLVGLGGVGKTRLAVQVALIQRQAEGFWDSVYIVPLEATPAASLVPTAIASALQIRDQGSAELLTLVERGIGYKHTLLVLDNFEHLVGGAVLLSTLLAACPNLKLLVTSRERLNLEEEFVYHLEGLPFSEADEVSLKEASISDAVTLFVDRARRAKRTFRLTDTNLPHVLEIVRRTNGLPLALELSATWVKVLTCEEIAQAFYLMDSPTLIRNLPERHRSLRVVFDHSWKLLTREEAEVLKKLSVLRGSFTREAAIEVAGATIPVLARLVDKSLLEITVKGRYIQHPLVHQYAREKLEAAGELTETHQNHLAFFLKLAETAEPHLTGPRQALWLNRLEDEYDNLRAALAWSTETNINISLQLGTAIWRFWVVRGYVREGREVLEKLLAHPETQSRSKARAAALNSLGTIIFETGDFTGSKPVLEEALSILRELSESREIATTLNHLGWITTQLSEIHASIAFNEEALNLNKQLENPRGVAVALNNLGWLAMYQSDFAKARGLFRESLELRRELGDERGHAYAQANLAWAEWRMARFTEADGLLDDALGKLRQLDDHQLVAWTLHQKGCLALARDNLEEAEKHARESVELWHKSSNHEGLALTLTTLADIVRVQGKLEEAATLLAEAQRIWQSLSGYKWAVACTLLSQAQLAFKAGDVQQAEVLIETSLGIRHEINDRHGIVECWEILAHLRASQSPERAVWLFSAAHRLRKRIEAPLPPCNQGNHERSIATLRTILGEKAFTKAWSMEQDREPSEIV